VLTKDAKASIAQGPKDSQSSVVGTLRASKLGGGQIPVEVRLGGGMPGASCAPRLRLRSAHGTAHGQDLL
jgi:hypothetical protein